MEHYKITREILKIGRKLSVRFHVDLKGSNDKSLIYEYKSKGSKGMTLNVGYYMTFDYKDDVQKWDTSKSILINEVTIYRVLKGFERIRKSIYEGDIFAMDKRGKVIMYADECEKAKELINVSSSQKILLMPAVITDINDLTYEGVIMYINNSENYVEIAIDQFEAIWHLLSKIDMFLYSQQLLNFYITYQDNKVVVKEDAKTTVNVFDRQQKSDEVTGTLVKEEDIFNGIEEDNEDEKTGRGN